MSNSGVGGSSSKPSGALNLPSTTAASSSEKSTVRVPMLPAGQPFDGFNRSSAERHNATKPSQFSPKPPAPHSNTVTPLSPTALNFVATTPAKLSDSVDSRASTPSTVAASFSDSPKLSDAKDLVSTMAQSRAMLNKKREQLDQSLSTLSRIATVATADDAKRVGLSSDQFKLSESNGKVVVLAKVRML
jgi:hypothetical protein